MVTLLRCLEQLTLDKEVNMKIEIKSDRFIYAIDDSGMTKDIFSRESYVTISLKNLKVIHGLIKDIDLTNNIVQIDDETYFVSDIVSMERYKMSDKPDMVNHPGHYISETGLEAIDVIEAFTFDLKGIEATDTGNVLKYMCRWKSKNGLEDLKKAQWYLNHLINHVEKLEKENDNYEENRNCKCI